MQQCQDSHGIPLVLSDKKNFLVHKCLHQSLKKRNKKIYACDDDGFDEIQLLNIFFFLNYTWAQVFILLLIIELPALTHWMQNIARTIWQRGNFSSWFLWSSWPELDSSNTSIFSRGHMRPRLAKIASKSNLVFKIFFLCYVSSLLYPSSFLHP